jgi:hypothetical protein
VLDVARFPQQAFMQSSSGTFFIDNVLQACEHFKLGAVQQLFGDMSLVRLVFMVFCV